MPPTARPSEDAGDGQRVPDYSAKSIAAQFRALESLKADVSSQLVRSVQETINKVKQGGREFGFLTAGEVREALGPEH